MNIPGSIEHAKELVDNGFAVFPVREKHPLTPNGFKDAVTNVDGVMELWENYGRGATGVGVATGSRSSVWVLDLDNKNGKSGDDTLAAWEDEASKVDYAWEVLTPSGGRHLYFSYDSFDPVGSKAALGPGVDIRGDGGYVVGPGSTFEGNSYEWEFSASPDSSPRATCPPSWLLEKVKKTLPSRPTKATSSELRDMLRDGTCVFTAPNGDEYWRRPGKARGEHSAVLHPPSASFPEGMLHVFTDGWPGLPEGTYGTPADDGTEFLEELKISMEAKEIEEHADGFVEWDFVDLLKAYEMGPLEPPTILLREDGVAMCYPGKLNYFYGPPECGKSWAAQLATVQVIENGGRVVYFDFENDARAFADRIVSLGLGPDTFDRVKYLNPNNMLRPEYFERVQKRISALKPELIVVDGVSNSMSYVPGPTGRPMSPLVHDDTLHFETRFLKQLLRNPDGSRREETALIAIDHTPKNGEEGKTPTIFGGQHKKAQIDGASFFFSIKFPFGRNMDGRSMICVDKDKPGHVRSHAIQVYFGDLAIYSRGGVTTARIEEPMAEAGSGFMPHKVMENITQFLETRPGITKGAIFDGVQGKTQNKEIALRALLERGFVRNDLAGGRYWVSKKYFEDPFKQTEAVEEHFLQDVRTPKEIADELQRRPV